MNFSDNLKKGTTWGLCLGMGLGSLAILVSGLIDFNSADVTDLAQIQTGIFYIIIFGIFGYALGGTVALFVVSVIRTLKVVHWVFAVLAGSVLNLLTALMGSIVGWTSISLIPILLIVRHYLAENSPQWIEKALNDAIVAFLTSLILTVIIFCFHNITGISLVKV
ncbi:hypothetical protein WKK05_34005 [Nostoc sp. UHCC 0302]|uniref:hypothetical protein n=1 Tax=Nostoc sp. UHCC 0302 TaxID=3134896 RepID=UPI00311CA9B3